MRFNFRKIASVLASAVMVGSTIGMAAAANYPAPFVTGGAADVAVVVGASAGASDFIAASDIGNNLASALASQTAEGTSGTEASTTGGDSYKLEKTSTKFHLGNGMNDVVSVSVTDDNLPNLLADGKYIDNDNDEFDYTQKIRLANTSLVMFEDNDYKPDEPTVGFKISSGTNILNYTLDFSDEPVWTDLATTDLPFMGKQYYVLSSGSATTNNTLTLLDSAADTTLAEGESVTLDVDGTSYEASISFIGTSEVKLEINGEITNSLQETETFKLSDGSYVGIKDISVQDYAGGVKQVEFSIGSGKLVLTNASDVELNDETITDLSVTINAASTLRDLTVKWDAEDDLFITSDSEITMPGFGAVKLSFAGMHYPKEETILVEPGSDTYVTLNDFPLKDSTEDINILYGNSSNFVGIGKDSDNLLKTSPTSTLVYDGDTDDYFVASWSDGNDAESYLMRTTNFKTTSGTNKTSFQYKKDGSWTDAKTEAENGDTVSVGNVELTVGYIHKTGKNVTITGGSNVNFTTLYSKEGMFITLPFNSSVATTTGAVNLSGNATAGFYPTTFALAFAEEDKNENKNSGANFNATLGWNSASTPEAHISDVVGESVSFVEIQDTDVNRAFMYSALATELLWDKSGDQNKLKIVYHGDESYGETFLNSPETTVNAGSTGGTAVSELGSVTVKDSEVSQVSGKNLIVVGGSCVNTVAEAVLGVNGPTCGADFTAATEVGADQALIKVVASPYASEKIAMLVAGYEAADTEKAVKYVTTESPSTAEGEMKLSTSSTVATVVE